jgi:hypothetical protein
LHERIKDASLEAAFAIRTRVADTRVAVLAGIGKQR